MFNSYLLPLPAVTFHSLPNPLQGSHKFEYFFIHPYR